ncbi:hypothetical protein DYE49_08460 [Treponema rectale]|uniref:SD-repeat containing protein B domain-containing protein n=1 Tax=Treponema rectale TaxID=744512 RepID=A0A840SAG5_9SPIR|nr:hypothetical protein [Treponema rectale]MBB5217785.1 hypothetical protein [Treponema rectale]QOS40488.1 hypothetical protein DYE49_08460 [Treponema rectale]
MKNNINKITWTWKKISASILAVLGIGTLTSCYGVVESYNTVYGKVSGDSDGDGVNEPVGGIKIDFVSDNETVASSYSSMDGEYYIDIDDSFSSKGKLVFTDVDGEKNGKWKTLEKEINLDTDDICKFDVTLDSDE